MKIVSVKEVPQYKEIAIAYIQSKWASEESKMVYEDCIAHCINAQAPLPQWYLLVDESKEGLDSVIGCAGLITNDFISRMDLYPWVCALYIEKTHRGNAYGALLLEQAKRDARKGGFGHLYLCSDHVGYYEKYGFVRMGTGYHPWGETSGIFQIAISR